MRFNITHSKALFALICVSFFCPLLTPNLTAADTAPTQARAKTPATWHLVFGVGEAPKRTAIFADKNVQTTAEGTNQITLVELFETHPQNVDFYVFTFEYNIENTQMRTLKAYRILKDNRLEFETEPSPWMAVPNNWMRVGHDICAQPDYFEKNKETSPKLGLMARPVDVVEAARRFLWVKKK